MEDGSPTRREFIAASAGVVAGAALTSHVAGAVPERPAGPTTQPSSKILNYNPKMGYRELGRTGIRISEVSLGGHGTRPGPNEQMVENRRRVLLKAAELGINYVDTNMAGECELYGQAIRDLRDRWHIGFACWPEKLTEDYESNLTAAGMMKEIEDRLKAYGTDRLDLWRPVGAALATDRTALVSRRVLDMVVEVFDRAKREGKVLHLGFSAHNPKVVQTVLENYPRFEVVLFPYLLLSEEAKGGMVVELAARKNVGVIAIKPFAAGAVFGLGPNAVNGAVDPHASVVLRKILEAKGISAVIPGVNEPEQLEVNVQASYERHSAMTPEEQTWLARYEAALRTHLPPQYGWLREWMSA